MIFHQSQFFLSSFMAEEKNVVISRIATSKNRLFFTLHYIGQMQNLAPFLTGMFQDSSLMSLIYYDLSYTIA